MSQVSAPGYLNNGPNHKAPLSAFRLLIWQHDLLQCAKIGRSWTSPIADSRSRFWSAESTSYGIGGIAAAHLLGACALELPLIYLCPTLAEGYILRLAPPWNMEMSGAKRFGRTIQQMDSRVHEPAGQVVTALVSRPPAHLQFHPFIPSSKLANNLRTKLGKMPSR